MANTLSLGSGNWGAKDSLLLGYYEDGKKFFPETFDVTRATGGTRVNKNGLIETPAEIGSELVVNGDFSNGSANWSLTRGNVINNELVFNTTGAPSGSRSVFAIQNNVADLTKVYKVQFTISNYVSGQFRLRKPFITTDTFGNGTYTYYGTASEINFELQGRLDIVHNFSIDNVSVKEYNDKNLARIDYLDDAKGALLTEPQSTNLFTYSENFSEWASYIITPTLNFATSPSGDNNATKLLSSGVFGSLKVDLTKPSSSLTYSQSVFVKTINYSIVNLISYGASSGNRAQVSFDLSDGSVSSAATVTGAFSNPSELIKNYGNGWYRITLTFTSDTSTEIRPHIQFPAQMTNDDYALIWGAQLEQENALGYNGEYSTSYIPTNGSTVTRNKDEVTNGGDVNSFNSEEGVLYAEIAALANSSNYRSVSLSDGTNTNRVNLTYSIASNSLLGFINVNGVNTTLSFTTIPVTDFFKCALKYKENDCSLWVNGVEVSNSTSQIAFPINTLTKLSFTSGSNGSYFYGKTSQVQVFNTALSDYELKLLTSQDTNYDSYEAMRLALNYNIQ